MKILTTLLFVLILLSINGAASENVTFEILQNSNGEYYVAYNDELIPCDDVYCTIFAENITHTNNTGNFTFELSTEEINRIAQRVALEIPQTEQQELNTTTLEELFGNNREQITDNLRSYILDNIVPEKAKFDELQNKLTTAELRIVELELKEINFDTLKGSSDETIALHKLENDKLSFISLMLGIGIIFLWLTSTPSGKEVLTYLAKFKRRG